MTRTHKIVLKREGVGKDLGLINIAHAAPQIAVLFIASATLSARGYEALFPICAGIALVGAVAVGRPSDRTA